LSFYGSVINYIARTFNKIKIKNNGEEEITLRAKKSDEILTLDTNKWIRLSPVNNDVEDKAAIKISHEPPQETKETTSISIDKNDISAGSTFHFNLLSYDENGHVSGLTEKEIKINIASEVARSTDKDAELERKINEEAARAKGEESRIDKRIDTLLGGVTDTFDTLLEIEEWINGDGINTVELTEAIAAEAKIRQEADAELSNRIQGNTTRLDTLQGTIDEEGSVAYMIAKESDSIDKKYETKDDAQKKLKEAKDYTDNSIAEIKVDSLYSPEAYYIADITQENGKIKPIW
jgi:hypothetical protein